MNYKEQIKHPKWQRKRLEIFERDNWKCRICQENNKQLQVHHLYYLPNTMIWDYDNEAMVTLCEEHHRQLTYDLSKLSGLIAFEILSHKYDFYGSR